MVLGYITCTDAKEAETLATALLEKKLIACGNIQGPVHSLYYWKKNGQKTLEKSNETVLVIKTLEKHTTSVIKWVKKLHSYTCPCILFYKVIDGNKDYISWVKQQMESP